MTPDGMSRDFAATLLDPADPGLRDRKSELSEELGFLLLNDCQEHCRGNQDVVRWLHPTGIGRQA
jgi:hypothetical protein